MDDEAFAQALALVTEYGACNASAWIMEQMRATPIGADDVFARWNAIGSQITEIMTATRH